MDFNQFLAQFIATYGMEILGAILTALAGCIGWALKNLAAKYLDDKTKQDVAKTCVKAVEQIYKDLHGEEKFNRALENASAILADKGITVSATEMKMLIESAVAEFNEVFSKTSVQIEAQTEANVVTSEADAKIVTSK